MMAVLSSLPSLLMPRMMPYFRSSLASCSSHSHGLIPLAFDVTHLYPVNIASSAARPDQRGMQTKVSAGCLMATL